jgi:predicted metalloprotease
VLAAAVAALGLAVAVPGAAQADERHGARAGQQGPAAPCASLEGCYGYDTMLDFYDDVIALVDEFSGSSYAAMPRPTYRYIAGGQVRPTACGPLDSLSYAYCPPDGTIYIGQDQLHEFYLRAGDAAAAFGIAHEWGHFVQDQAGVLDAAGGSRAAGIAAENQADCIGGAFLGRLRDRDVLEPDDYDDVDLVLPMIAATEEDSDRSHGTLAEREAATRWGHDRGLVGCNDFFPSLPVIS